MAWQGQSTREVELVDADQVEHQHRAQGDEGQADGQRAHLLQSCKGHRGVSQEPH